MRGDSPASSSTTWTPATFLPEAVNRVPFFSDVTRDTEPRAPPFYNEGLFGGVAISDSRNTTPPEDPV
jgi:hypothetical protein